MEFRSPIFNREFRWISALPALIAAELPPADGHRFADAELRSFVEHDAAEEDSGLCLYIVDKWRSDDSAVSLSLRGRCVALA